MNIPNPPLIQNITSLNVEVKKNYGKRPSKWRYYLRYQKLR